MRRPRNHAAVFRAKVLLHLVNSRSGEVREIPRRSADHAKQDAADRSYLTAAHNIEASKSIVRLAIAGRTLRRSNQRARTKPNGDARNRRTQMMRLFDRPNLRTLVPRRRTAPAVQRLRIHALKAA